MKNNGIMDFAGGAIVTLRTISGVILGLSIWCTCVCNAAPLPLPAVGKDEIRGSGVTQLDDEQFDGTSYVIPDVSRGRAENNTTDSEDSGPKSPPRAVISVTVESLESGLGVRWTVSGFSPAGAGSTFSILYGTEPGRYGRKIDVGSVSSYRLHGLNNGQTYYIRVKARLQEKESPIYSAEVAASPLATEDLPSRIEKSYSHKIQTLQDHVEPERLARDLKQFGYDFFRNRSAAAPSDSVPVGPDYTIGPGDSVRVDVWGTLNARYDATVDRNGEIVIPRAGAIKVWGLTYAQAKEAINRAMSRYFRGYDLNVTLGSLRNIQVFVVGEVGMPGAYMVNALSTPVNVLSVAGGPTKNGSLRNVRVMRKGKLVYEIDLYDLFLAGDRSKDSRLENGDTVVVPVIGPIVAVAGEVKRPGIYELKGQGTIQSVVEMAGGVTPAGDGGRLQVERVQGNNTRLILDKESVTGNVLATYGDFSVVDNDMVKIYPVSRPVRQIVTLEGHVFRPGEYQFQPGMTIRDLVRSFAAIMPEPFTDMVRITRLVGPDYHRETLSVNLKKALEGDLVENIPLAEQDVVRIFSNAEMTERKTVVIAGEVFRPDTYDFFPNMTVRDLVTAAGSLKRSAYLDRAELSRVIIENGKARSFQLVVNLQKALSGDPTQNIPLQSYDVLVVRSIPEWSEATDKFVTLKGEVRFPGQYAVSKGEKLTSVLERAGGYTEKAYLKGARFIRKSVQENQQKRLEEVLAKMEADIAKRQGELTSLATSKEELEATKAALEGLMKDVARLRNSKAEGRVVVQLAPLPELAKSDYDLELMGGDVLEIPERSDVVSIIGQVYNPTTLVHLTDKSVSHYLKKAGGPTRDAEEKEMYVIKADGSVVSRQQSSIGFGWDNDQKRWNFGGFMAMKLEAGDTLVIPQKLERVAWMREIKDITTILSQVAITAGVIVAAGL